MLMGGLVQVITSVGCDGCKNSGWVGLRFKNATHMSNSADG